MNNALYLVRNKRVDEIIGSFIIKYKLELCYNTKKEKILKNENVILSQKKKYIFLRVFAEDSWLLFELKQSLGM